MSQCRLYFDSPLRRRPRRGRRGVSRTARFRRPRGHGGRRRRRWRLRRRRRWHRRVLRELECKVKWRRKSRGVVVHRLRRGGHAPRGGERSRENPACTPSDASVAKRPYASASTPSVRSRAVSSWTLLMCRSYQKKREQGGPSHAEKFCFGTYQNKTFLRETGSRPFTTLPPRTYSYVSTPKSKRWRTLLQGEKWNGSL